MLWYRDFQLEWVARGQKFTRDLRSQPVRRRSSLQCTLHAGPVKHLQHQLLQEQTTTQLKVRVLPHRLHKCHFRQIEHSRRA